MVVVGMVGMWGGVGGGAAAIAAAPAAVAPDGASGDDVGEDEGGDGIKNDGDDEGEGEGEGEQGGVEGGMLLLCTAAAAVDVDDVDGMWVLREHACLCHCVAHTATHLLFGVEAEPHGGHLPGGDLLGRYCSHGCGVSAIHPGSVML